MLKVFEFCVNYGQKLSSLTLCRSSKSFFRFRFLYLSVHEVAESLSISSIIVSRRQSAQKHKQSLAQR